VPISEAARHDLYTGLAALLGPERTKTLMSALPSYEITDVATKGDIALLLSRIDRLEARMDGLEARMDRLEARMDRFFVALVAGMFLIVATLIGGFFTL